MLSKTHIVSTVSIGTIPLIFFNIFSSEQLNFYLIGLILGSLLPDIDEPNSAIGRRTFILSFFINKIFGHRGFTHMFAFSLVSFLLLSFIAPFLSEKTFCFFLGLSFGILLHQMGDMLSGDSVNKGGINDYFFPFGPNKRIHFFPRFLRCKIGGIKEHIYFFIFLMLLFNNLIIITQNNFILLIQ